MCFPICPDRLANSATILVVIFALLTSTAIGSNTGKKAEAQENSTSSMDDVRTMLQNDRADLAEVKNMTAREISILSEINVTSTKLATQAAYTALSVFFMGIALVIFGLRLTTKGIAHLGKYLTLMVWALTVPVIILVSVFQVGIITNGAIRFHETEEPFFVLSFLMYIPIGIILFLLMEQRKIIRSQAAKSTDHTERHLIQELEKIFTMKESGMITNEEYQKLKSELIAKL